MMAERNLPPQRAVFVSDLHLGSRDSQAGLLARFLEGLRTEKLYLVGDVFDFWKLNKGWRWGAAESRVVRAVFDLAARGVEIIYLPGNHDEATLPLAGTQFGPIKILRECVHETADGRRFLVLHGDAFDGIVCYGGWRTRLGEWAYAALLAFNTQINTLRMRKGHGYWSLAGAVKSKVARARAFIDRFERAVAAEAQSRGVDGVICGHIHVPTMREINGLLYINDGDWVESCSALVEDPNGQMQVIFPFAAETRASPASDRIAAPTKAIA